MVDLTLLWKGAEEIVLETESTNKAALRLYESLGFSRVKRMQNYYMSGNDAFRLKLWFVNPEDPTKAIKAASEN
jgi:peptide alpha-N-acetyltransferase